MAATITEISIRGYKSIHRLDGLPLRDLNVLVGANGAGKSNFVSFFSLIRQVVAKRLQTFVQASGGGDALLHLGPRRTEQLVGRMGFHDVFYECQLIPTVDNGLAFDRERVGDYSEPNGDAAITWFNVGVTTPESQLGDKLDPTRAEFSYADEVRADAHKLILSLTAYHFDDTSPAAGVRRWGGLNDDERLRPDASNLAAFLHRIRVTHPDHLGQIRDVVRLAAPFFDDFKLRPIPTNPDQIQLEWTQAGTDYPFRPSQLSDGTLRFICLATALLQPDPPAVMMFDEPELGLHPYALTLLTALFRQAAAGPSQIIVSTQSATLLNEFDAEDVIVVERDNGASTFRRLDPAALTEWLAEYAVGELWQKNVIGGQPAAESGGVP